MKSIVTTKKKLELKKTAIANLSMSKAQMRMVVGGGNAQVTKSVTCHLTTSQAILLTDCGNDSRGHCIPENNSL